MKRCPTCSRNYSDDTLSFCLDDGSILSAVHDTYTSTPAHADDPSATQEWKPDSRTAETFQLTSPTPTSGAGLPIYSSAGTRSGPVTGRGSSSKLWLLIGAAVMLIFLALMAGLAVAYKLLWSRNKETVLTKQQETQTKSPGSATPTPTPRATPTPAPTPRLEIGGTWIGTFDTYRSTMNIDEGGENSFTGTITGSEFQVAIAGKLNPITRKIDFKETKVLRYKGEWKLGTNYGTVSTDGRKMSGKGKSVGVYTWSFNKK